MATKAMTATQVKEFTFLWEGRDRAGKTIRGEMRAGGESGGSPGMPEQGEPDEVAPGGSIAPGSALPHRLLLQLLVERPR